MQSQSTLKSAASQIRVLLQNPSVQLVILGSLLLLTIVVIVWELSMVGHSHLFNMTQIGVTQPDEGPIDSITTQALTL